MSLSPLFRLLGLIPLLPFALAHAASYRWVDESGVTIYSQTPPPQGVSASEIKPPPPPPQASEGELAPTGTAAEEKTAAKEKDPKQEKKGKEDEKATGADKKKADERRQQNCENARKNKSIVENRQFKTVRKPDGTTQTLDDEARESMRSQAEQSIKDFCGKGE